MTDRASARRFLGSKIWCDHGLLSRRHPLNQPSMHVSRKIGRFFLCSLATQSRFSLAFTSRRTIPMPPSTRSSRHVRAVTLLAAAKAPSKKRLAEDNPVPLAIVPSTPLAPASKRNKSSAAVVTPPIPETPLVSEPERMTKQPPKGWQDIYSLVEELRQDRTAPCVSHGSCRDDGTKTTAGPYRTRLHFKCIQLMYLLLHCILHLRLVTHAFSLRA